MTTQQELELMAQDNRTESEIFFDSLMAYIDFMQTLEGVHHGKKEIKDQQDRTVV